MKRLMLTAVILTSLTACNKKPVEESTEPTASTADIGNMDLADLKPQGDTSEKADWPLDAATEQKAEAAAIAMLLCSYSRAYGANAQPTIGLRYEPFWITGPLLIRKD